DIASAVNSVTISRVADTTHIPDTAIFNWIH
ncbi:MAG: hypothetical protein ACI96M_003600, partial [Candidatus Azotimanducaceae bacterium]